MKLIHVLLVYCLFGCSDDRKYVSNGDCSQGDFYCGNGLECTAQLTLEGPRYGCTPIDAQTPPPPSMEPAIEAITGGRMSEDPLGGAEMESEPGEKGEDFMSDFVPSEQDSMCAADTPPGADINRDTAQECLEVFQCFNTEECDQFMMLEEEQECVDMCITAASPPAQIAFANFANCLRLNCVTTAGELMGEECILDNCFYQADACNLIIRE